MSGIGVIVNARSRYNRHHAGGGQRLARVLGDSGEVRVTRSIDDLQRAVEQFRRLDVDVIAISGGDGTNSLALERLRAEYGDARLPDVALLRGGTMNIVADSLGVPLRSPHALLKALVRRYARRHERPLPRVERRLLHVGPHCGFFFGTGVIRGFLAEYYRHRDPSRFHAAKTLLRSALSSAVAGPLIRRIAEPLTVSVQLELGGAWPERDYLGMLGGTVDELGLGFRVFPRYAENPSGFHLIGLRGPPLEVARALPNIWRGRPMPSSVAVEATPRTAVLASTRGPIRYTVNGDLYEAERELVIAAGEPIGFVMARGELASQARLSPAAPAALDRDLDTPRGDRLSAQRRTRLS